MNRKDFDVAAGIVERMDKLEKTIFELQGIMDKKSYTISANNDPIVVDESNLLELVAPSIVELIVEELATLVFIQDILQYYIDTLNLELDELRKTFEEI